VAHTFFVFATDFLTGIRMWTTTSRPLAACGSFWAERTYGPEFVKFLRQNYECTDILFRLAEQSGVVLLDGGGFGGPKWSVRVSLANLPEEAYGKIGEYLREAAEEYVAEWRSAQKKNGR